MPSLPTPLTLLALVALAASGCAPSLMTGPATLERADAIVVLGNRPPTDAEGRVRPETDRRVRTGVALWRRGLAPKLVVTGGPAPHDKIEAEVMRDHAIALGVDPAAITIEPTARDTIGNARESVRLLCPDGPCEPRIIVVSSPYHLERAGDLFECAGADVQVAGTPVPEGPGYRLRFTMSERVVRAAYLFMDACDAARPTWPEPAR